MWAPCLKQQIPIGYLLYIEQCVCSSAPLSIVPPHSLPAVCFLCPHLRGCPLAVTGGSSSLVWCRLLSAVVSLVAEHGLSCRTACGVVLDRGSNPCPLHWKVIPNHWLPGKSRETSYLVRPSPISPGRGPGARNRWRLETSSYSAAPNVGFQTSSRVWK